MPAAPSLLRLAGDDACHGGLRRLWALPGRVRGDKYAVTCQSILQIGHPTAEIHIVSVLPLHMQVDFGRLVRSLDGIAMRVNP